MRIALNSWMSLGAFASQRLAREETCIDKCVAPIVCNGAFSCFLVNSISIHRYWIKQLPCLPRLLAQIIIYNTYLGSGDKGHSLDNGRYSGSKNHGELLFWVFVWNHEMILMSRWCFTCGTSTVLYRTRVLRHVLGWAPRCILVALHATMICLLSCRGREI